MSRAALICVIALAAPLGAALAASDAEPQPLSPPDSWQPRQHGTLRVLNKIDGTVQTVTIETGQALRVQSLVVRISGCFVRPPDLPEDATAHLTIDDTRDPGHRFDGWVLKKEPALNMLEHPVYDIQLAGCG